MGLWPPLSCSAPAQDSRLHCGGNLLQTKPAIWHPIAIILLVSCSMSFAVSHTAQPQAGPDRGSHGTHGAPNPLPPEGSHPSGSAKLPIELLQHLHEALQEPWEAPEGRAISQAHGWEKSLDGNQPHIVSSTVKASRRQLGESHVADTGLRQPLSLSEYWATRKNSTGPWPKVYLYKLPSVFKDDTYFGGSMPNYAAEKTAPELGDCHPPDKRPHLGIFAGSTRAPILPPDVDPNWPPYTIQTLMCATPPLIKGGNPTVHMYPNRPRELQLYFAGTLGLDVARYSHGVRQTVTQIFGLKDTHPGRMFVAGNDPQYGPRFANSRFCLAASGAGWGVRFKVALMCGCIPLVISDYVELEKSDVFRLEDISVRLPESYIYALPEALDYIESHFPEKLRAMQRRVACAWRYWVWTEPYGRAGEAFACSLRRKLMGHDRLVPRMDWNTCTLSSG